MLKVYKAIPAYNNTVVFSSLLSAGHEIIYHYDSNGNLIWQHPIGDLFDAYCMPNDHILIYLRPEEGNIHIVDLKQKKRKTIKHLFMNDVSCQIYVDFFCETNLLCIHENGDHYQIKLNLTYYRLEDILNAKEDEEVESYAEFRGDAEQWHCGYLVRKVNARSKYVWTETRFQDNIMVRMH